MTPHTTSISLPLALEDGNTTWDESGECAGLTIGDEDEMHTNDDVNAECIAPKFQTKLLGLSVYPADEVNPDGVFVGNVFVRNGARRMETGAFVSEGSPALIIDFWTVSDMPGGENSLVVVPIQMDRGTIWEQK